MRPVYYVDQVSDVIYNRANSVTDIQTVSQKHGLSPVCDQKLSVI